MEERERNGDRENEKGEDGKKSSKKNSYFVFSNHGNY